MPTLTLRVDDATRDALESMAAGRDATVSDLLRDAIRTLLGRESDPASAPTVPQSLTLVQRRTLALQHEILAELTNEPDPYEFDERLPYHRERAEVLYRGYTGEYGDEFSLDPEMARTECRLVWDLLDMFRVVRASIERLSETDRVSLGEDVILALRFRGFDGNDEREGAMLSYSRHLLRSGRWTDLLPQFAENDNGNSHWPTLGTYLRMLAVYKPLWSAISSRLGRDELLSVGDLRAIAEARG